MKLVNLIEEDFVNYRKPGMFLGFPVCSGKCNTPISTVCQNEALMHLHENELIDISAEEIIKRYKENQISKCLICGGLEPFDSFKDLIDICSKWSNELFIAGEHKYNPRFNNDPIIIYTGYYPFEIIDKIEQLESVCKVQTIIKYGRFILGHKPHRDPVLGVMLASDNQYAETVDLTIEKIQTRTW